MLGRIRFFWQESIADDPGTEVYHQVRYPSGSDAIPECKSKQKRHAAGQLVNMKTLFVSHSPGVTLVREKNPINEDKGREQSLIHVCIVVHDASRWSKPMQRIFECDLPTDRRPKCTKLEKESGTVRQD